MNIFKTCAILLGVITLSMISFISLFIAFNLPGLDAKITIIAMGIGYTIGLIYFALPLTRLLWNNANQDTNDGRVNLYRVLFLAVSAMLVYVFVSITVIDYYQAITIFDEVIIALATTWVLTILFLLLLCVGAQRLSAAALQKSTALVAVILAGIPVMASIEYINSPEPNRQLDYTVDVFKGGEDGYKTYRIPSLLVVPKGSTLANGRTLKSDLMLAIAEARRDAALDTGVIDLVLKTSIDQGQTWSPQQRICRHESEGKIGKCGNPTPVFDSVTGKIHLAHNLSGLKEGGPQSKILHTAVIIVSGDGGETWGERKLIAENNLIFGPGHGIQKQLLPHAQRLLIPGYIHRKNATSNDNRALVIYSDDNGESWQSSSLLDTGDETEIAELQDGRLYLATRQHAKMGMAPKPNGRLWSVSSDGGTNWQKAQKDLSLKTPVCQSSVLRLDDKGGLLFANPAHEKTRVNMTINYSKNNGDNWSKQTQIYSGPSGYSNLGKLSNNKVAVIYENGTISYSEKISLSVVKDKILIN